jgi:molecular chaperone GrpE (heat shock protein)
VIPVRLDAATRAVTELERRVEELARLRRHDADLVDRLHAENSRLRQGELTEAMAPLLRGLIRLHDQMTSLGGDDPQSVAGILRGQLLQILDVTVDVRPYTAAPGAPFDPAIHLGVRGTPTDDPGRDRTIVRTVKPGFVRGDTTVVRPAETEVYRAR